MKQLSLAELNIMCQNSIHSALGIVFTEVGTNRLVAEMPVDHRTRQPFGVLHGGASVVLAESLGSMAAYLALEGDDKIPVGIEVNANHLKSIRDGIVTGTASPIHLGQTLHVWQVEVRDATGELVCTSRLTVLIRERPTRPT